MTALVAVVCASLGIDVAKTKLDVVLHLAVRSIYQGCAHTPQGFETLDNWLQQEHRLLRSERQLCGCQRALAVRTGLSHQCAQ